MKTDTDRRRLLALLGAAMLGGRVQAQNASLPAPACVLAPEQTEGPFFFDERLQRSDLRGAGLDGAPLALTLRVLAVGRDGCRPLAGAMVDLWHCDARGIYSGTREAARHPAGDAFLRGYQLSDGNGVVRFATVYPGAYPGRAVHLHFKVRARQGSRLLEFASQLYFDDILTDRIHAQAPYRQELRRVRNASDFLYRQGGTQLMLPVKESAAGMQAFFDVGVQAG